MKSSDSIGELNKALVQAQAEMPFAPMNAKNPFIGNNYADLGAVIQASRPVLHKHGLCISQFPTSSDDGKVGVRSILIHSSGEWMEDSIFLELRDNSQLNHEKSSESTPPKKEKVKTISSIAQEAGVVITYLRRYSWAAIIGMYADEDNDGELRNEEKKSSSKKTEDKPTVQKIQRLWNEHEGLRDKFKPLFSAYEPKKGNPYKINNPEKELELLNKMEGIIADSIPETKAEEKSGD